MLEQDWWPPLRRRYADPGDTPATTWTADQKRAGMIHHPSPTPHAVVEAYPAHVHMNFLPRAQGQGVGLGLLAAWLAAAAERTDAKAAGGVHVGVNAGNARALRFWRRHGFEVLRPEGRTVWMGRD